MTEEVVFWMIVGYLVIIWFSYTYVKTMIKDWFKR